VDVLTRNNVVVSGRAGAQPMLFVHGFGCDQHMWRFVAPEFGDDHRIVLLDHVGAGESDLSAYDPARYDSLDQYATDVIEVCEALEMTDIVYVGHSVSAMIGVLAGVRRPDLFDRIVLVSPSPRFIDDDGYTGGFSHADVAELLTSLDSNYLGWASAMAPVVMGAPDRPELGEELHSSFCRTDPEIARQFARVTFTADNREDLLHLQVPALVIQCSDDALAPQAVGEYVHRSLPDSEYVLLQATGHCPNLSEPAATVAAIRDFLDADSVARTGGA
jgi:sigma-B regulation protein RsbQ